MKDIKELYKLLSLKSKVTIFMPLFFCSFYKKIFFPKSIKRFVGKIYDKIFYLSSVKSIKYIEEEFSNIFEIFEQEDNGTLYSKKQINEFLESLKTGLSDKNICSLYNISQFSFERWVGNSHKFISTDLRLLEKKIDRLLSLMEKDLIK